MDFGKKPKHENPRKGANPISQLFFLWITPLLWKGMKNGLKSDDLCKCLKNDKSEVLGDDLERLDIQMSFGNQYESFIEFVCE